MAITTDQVNAALVTLSQNTLAITGNTMAPHKAPTKTSMTKMSSAKLAKIIPTMVATIMLTRPLSSVRLGWGLSLAIFLPSTSAIIMADSAHRSESAVEDREPMSRIKNRAIIMGDK